MTLKRPKKMGVKIKGGSGGGALTPSMDNGISAFEGNREVDIEKVLILC